MATTAHDMEVRTTTHYDNSSSFAKPQKDKAEFKRNVEFSKNSTKEAISIFKAELVGIMGKS